MRETERVMVRMEAQVRKRVCDYVSESERLRLVYIYGSGMDNIHTLPI